MWHIFDNKLSSTKKLPRSDSRSGGVEVEVGPAEVEVEIGEEYPDVEAAAAGVDVVCRNVLNPSVSSSSVWKIEKEI